MVGADFGDIEDPIVINQPTGYAYDPDLHEEAASSCETDFSAYAGATKKLIEQGVTYFNLTSFAASLLAAPAQSNIVTSLRPLIDCGPDGMVLMPLSQNTGISAGTSVSEQLFLMDCFNYKTISGSRVPLEYAFVWPYLAGRDLARQPPGDTGSFPSGIAIALQELGALPVDCGGPYDFTRMKPHGTKSQESLCVAMRDKPVLLEEWESAAKERKYRALNPGKDPWLVADLITCGRPVNKSSQHQINVAPGPRSNGVSSLHKLEGRGQVTCFVGWAIVAGRLVLVTLESWYQANKFPAGKYKKGRVLLRTDGLDHWLYPGQGAAIANDFVPLCTELRAFEFLR